MKKLITLSKRLVKIVSVVLTLIISGNIACAQTTYYDTYAFRIPLTLNNTSLGITTNQTNFVALVKVTSPVLASGVCSDLTGGLSSSVPVFAIIDSAYSTTQELYYQVENYNATTGVIYFWVRLPTLYSTSSGLTNKLYCYFGATGAGPSVQHTTLWQKSTWSNVVDNTGTISYSGVYHFNESPSNPAPQFMDATVNDNNLFIGSTGTVSQNTGAQIGNGITLSTTSVLDTAAINLPKTQNNQSLSIWVNYPTAPASTLNFIVLENSDNPATTGNGTQLGVLSNSGYFFQTWRWANRNTPLVRATSVPSSGTWHHFVYTYNASTTTSYFYVDGAQVQSENNTTSGNLPFSGSPNNGVTNMVAFGDYINNNIGTTGLHVVGGQSYTGSMDESHVIGATLSADWVKAEYVNQKTPAAFTTAGSMQTNSLRASTMAGYLSYTWKGVNTSVTNASNWNNTTSGVTNEVPVDANVDWVIPSGLTKYPILTADTGLYALTIGSGAYINLNGHTLSVGCNIYNSSGGQILYASNTSSKVKWNGSISSQYYYGTNTALTAQVGSMEVNNSSAGTINITGGPFDVFNLLTITKGNLVVGASPAVLTLKSNSALTASVTAIPAAYSISGNVSVERYISGGSNAYRGYRLLSSPIYTASSGSNYYYDLSYLPNYGPVTSSLGTSGGFYKIGNPSIYLYRGSVLFTNRTFNTGNFRGVNAINHTPLYNIGVDYDGNFNLHVGTGIMYFYRGSNANIATKFVTSTSAEANTFVSTGTLNQQAVTVVDWYTGLSTLPYTVVAGNVAGYAGFNLVGNPYASSIDWNTYSTTNSAAGIYAPGVGKTIYICNVVAKTYATYSNGIGVNGGTNIISSGQGFFVKTGATGASLTFNEAAKTNSQVTGPTLATGNTLLLSASPTDSTTLQYIRLNLAADSINKEETVVRFDSGAKNNFVFDEDAQHMPGSGEVGLYSMSTDSVPLAINDIPYPKPCQVIKLNVSATSNGQYSINQTEIQNIPALFDIWLKDAYMRDSLDIKHNSTYRFNVLKSDTNTYGANRFTLVIRQNKALGIHLLNFAANKSANGALTVWNTENEANYTNFTLERSTNGGVTYEDLGGFQSNSLGTYNFLDKAPPMAVDQYRLKIEDLNGTISYSNVVTLMYGNTQNNLAQSAISIYPNPTKGTINMSINTPGNVGSQVSQNVGATTSSTAPNAVYAIKIVNNTGSVIKSATTTQAAWTTDVSNFIPGTYIIQVINSNNNSVVGKGTFVKL